MSKDEGCKDCKDGKCSNKQFENNTHLTQEETVELIRRYADFPLTTYLANMVGIDPLIVGCFIVNRKVTPEEIGLLIDFFELLTGRAVLDDYGIVPTDMH
ncbi:MAG: hypothetical protein HY999_03590 [Nitrospinae bacterium]|nr:hypothetical protein [Nitrospinota bacterium]